MLKDVFAIRDISEIVSERLATLCRVLHPLDTLFPELDNGVRAADLIPNCNLHNPAGLNGGVLRPALAEIYLPLRHPRKPPQLPTRVYTFFSESCRCNRKVLLQRFRHGGMPDISLITNLSNCRDSLKRCLQTHRSARPPFPKSCEASLVGTSSDKLVHPRGALILFYVYGQYSDAIHTKPDRARNPGVKRSCAPTWPWCT